MLEWFESVAGPAYAPALMWTLLALVGLVVVILAVRLVKSLTSGTFVVGGRNRKARLAVMDAAAVDGTRRLILVRRDDVEHLLLVGGPTDVVVEQDIRLHGLHPGAETEPAAVPVVAAHEAPRPVPGRGSATVPHPPRAVEREPAPAAPVPERAAPVPEHRQRPAPQSRPAAPVEPPPQAKPVAPSGPPRQPTATVPPQPQARPEPAFETARTEPKPPVTGAAAAALASAPQAEAPPTSGQQPRADAPDPAPAGDNASVHGTAASDADEGMAELDDALLQELEVTLDDGQPRHEAEPAPDRDQPDDLDAEMSRLLGELSGERR